MYLPTGPPKGAALTINQDRSTASCHSVLYSSTFLLKKNTFCEGPKWLEFLPVSLT